jgi:hypothetical protein
MTTQLVIIGNNQKKATGFANKSGLRKRKEFCRRLEGDISVRMAKLNSGV